MHYGPATSVPLSVAGQRELDKLMPASAQPATTALVHVPLVDSRGSLGLMEPDARPALAVGNARIWTVALDPRGTRPDAVSHRAV